MTNMIWSNRFNEEKYHILAVCHMLWNLLLFFFHCNTISDDWMLDVFHILTVCSSIGHKLFAVLKAQIEDYLHNFNEEALPEVFKSILMRRLSGKYEEDDEKLMDELKMKPLDNVTNEEFESDFEEIHETDEEIEDLYDARDVTIKRMASDPYFNMDDKKWDDMIKEATEHGYLKDTRECEEILEDMLKWDTLLPGNAINLICCLTF